jgi:hypothetical protein
MRIEIAKRRIADQSCVFLSQGPRGVGEEGMERRTEWVVRKVKIVRPSWVAVVRARAVVEMR